MGDSYQNGWVTTLHNLRNRTTEELEERLAELEGDALPRILDELQKVII